MVLKILGLVLGAILCFIAIIKDLKGEKDSDKVESLIIGFIGFAIIRLVLKYL